MITGAASVMDCSDLRDVFDNLGIPALYRVLDVGCGTGRLSSMCLDYTGVDIAIDAISYCQHRGLNVYLIDGPYDLKGTFDTVCCLSVFTHIGRSERRQYLSTFRQMAHELVVDIMPGGEHGDVSCWYADTTEFEGDLDDSNYEIVEVYSRVSPDNATHRYYRAEHK
jgi:SAM-dependent methyltransferase